MSKYLEYYQFHEKDEDGNIVCLYCIVKRTDDGICLQFEKDYNTALKELEEFIHPKVKQEIINVFNGIETERNIAGLIAPSLNKNIIFISIPLLFETGFEILFDKIIFVQCDDDLRLQRLIKRNNYTEEYAKKRMNSQLPQEDKIKNSDFVLNNNSSKEDLKAKVLELLKKLG